MASVRYFGSLWMTFNEELQGQISACFYICHSGDSDSGESTIPLVEIPIRVSTSGD